MQTIGKILILAGSLLLILGVVLSMSDKIPFLGKLPGDISVKRENFQLYVPITTSILLSILVSAVLWIITQFKGR